jgi:hypothetical protein
VKKRRKGKDGRSVPAFLFDSNDVRTKPTPCLNCGKLLDACTPVKNHDAKPDEGSLSLCWACGHLQVFQADGTFRELTGEEVVEVAGDPDIIMANTMRGPWRDLYDRRETMKDAEKDAALHAIASAIIKNQRRKERP